jgi:N-acetylmuramoyl-L-alanine amidase
MKLIHKFKSLNFDQRKNKQISFLIIHYTALPSIEESINYLCEKKNKVSCHYIISQNGKIYNLVSEKYRAWHAGKSYWLAEKDINSSSIGIELDFSPNHNNDEYSKSLIDSLILLIRHLKKKYKIDKKNILGHSDIAPYRKIDPGKKFPWQKLYNLNLSYIPKKISLIKLEKIRTWFKKNKINSNKNKILIMLNFIGYDVSKSINSKYFYKILISNYKSHYFQKDTNKGPNTKLINFIELHFCNLLLT